MIRVDLHCHSNVSDGALTPAALADRLAADKVAVAALTDHDSIAGLEEFRRRLTRHGIACIPAVEISALHRGKAAHLLAYGFDPAHPELRANLDAIRRCLTGARDSIAGALRERHPDGTAHVAPLPGAVAGRLELRDAIALVHRAGGRAFLAHPLFMEPSPDKLDALLPELQALGLDGIEAIYPAFTPDQQSRLLEIARRRRLLVCAGSDFHHSGMLTGVEFPLAHWQAFRNALLASRPNAPPPGPERPPERRARPIRRLSFILRIVLPTLVALGLFAIALLNVILPALEHSLLERKRETIRELVNAAWGVLAEADQEVRQGEATMEQAQRLARRRIETMRYGPDGKDYFWLQDLHPRILMHPYRPDLNGHDVTEFRDARGVAIFVEFANLVRRQNEGFVDYVWQWKDDPRRLAPKESYIRGFPPWGWVVGTGMYIEDVAAETARFERHLLLVVAGIGLAIILLLLYVIRESLGLEQARREAEDNLRATTERYRAIVEAAHEGTLLLIGGRCRYANPTLLAQLGYSETEIELLDLADILPGPPDNARVYAHLRQSATSGADNLAGTLRTRDGRLLDGCLSLHPIAVAGNAGLILQVREAVPRDHAHSNRSASGAAPDTLLPEIAQNLSRGLFRAQAHARGAIVTVNPAALELLPALGAGDADQPAELAVVFETPAAFEDFRRELERTGLARHRLHRPLPDGRRRTISLEARLIHDEHGNARCLDGCVEDTTAEIRRDEERDALIARLQTALLFLHEPVERLWHPTAPLSPDTPIRQVAELMTAQDSDALLVRSEGDAPPCLVTDRLLRTRLIAGDIAPDQPVRRIAREPALTIPRGTPVYEALLTMQTRGVEHLAVTDEQGLVAGLLHSRDILNLHHHEATFLTETIARAATPDAVADACRRAPMLVTALLDAGAHTRQITRLVSSICESATQRLAELAFAELGPPPCPFVFLALGSHGRREMTPLADQDNALLFDPPDAAGDTAAAQAYFLRLGERICAGLDHAGYPFCRGGIMARNPAWCRALQDWEQVTTAWIRGAAPQQVLEFNAFLDFRPVLGNPELAARLRFHVRESLRATPAFLPFLARDMLRFRPPSALWLRRLLGAHRPGATLFDVKEAMMPIEGFARLYALRHRIEETHTLDRLEALGRRGLISEADLRETELAYNVLLGLRLAHHAANLRDGRPADNQVDRARLDSADRARLRGAFVRVAAIQKRISYEFLGGT